jgi:hypothetical protein
MWYPTRKQWWVIWIVTFVVLEIWWSGVRRAAESRVEAEYLQTRHLQPDDDPHLTAAQVAALSNHWSDYTDKVQAAIAEEQQPRWIVTVIAFGVLGVWKLSKPKGVR